MTQILKEHGANTSYIYLANKEDEIQQRMNFVYSSLNSSDKHKYNIPDILRLAFNTFDTIQKIVANDDEMFQLQRYEPNEPNLYDEEEVWKQYQIEMNEFIKKQDIIIDKYSTLWRNCNKEGDQHRNNRKIDIDECTQQINELPDATTEQICRIIRHHLIKRFERSELVFMEE